MIDIDNNAQAYILSEVELKILLAGYGFESFFGAIDEAENGKKEVYQTLAKMVNEKKLIVSNDNIFVNDSLEKIIEIIGKADKVLQIKQFVSNINIEIYIGEKTIVVNHSEYQNDILRISVASPESVIEQILNFREVPFSESNISNDEEKLWVSDTVLASLTLYEKSEKKSCLSVYCNTVEGVFLRFDVDGNVVFDDKYDYCTMITQAKRMIYSEYNY